MKRMMRGARGLVVALVCAVCGTAGAGEFKIQSFDGTGQLTFNRVATATVYRVEWAPTPSGPWTNFTGAAGAALDNIAQFSSGSYTCSVPMCYRVVATVTNAAPPQVPQGMVLIPAGTNSGADPDFGAYSLTVEAFYMDATEVTKAMWDEVRIWAADNGYADLAAGGGKAANHPVQTVNWYDVAKWCNARSQKAGRTPVYYTDAAMTQEYKTGDVSEPYVKASADGYRLPTDVQWEYAARGGVSSWRFPWSDADTIQHARANYYSSSSYAYDTSPTRDYHPTYATGGTPYTSPAGSFAPNGYGLYDMAGNVWEWCYDWYPGYEGSGRVLRGGGWGSYASYCRVAYRSDDLPDYRRDDYGFRAVLPPGQQ
jgi:formylglycine-generating enzyme required for sulfatase activity